MLLKEPKVNIIIKYCASSLPFTYSLELIQINLSHIALQGLHELIMSRKFKYYQINLEPILFKYLELAVDLRKGKMAREALSQYRYHTQNTNIASLEV